MTKYQDLHWSSINFLKNHLYRRIASPLNAALGRLAIGGLAVGALSIWGLVLWKKRQHQLIAM